MTDLQFNTLDNLISKTIKNSHNIGINLDAFIKTVDTDFLVIKSQNEEILYNQRILDAKLDKLLTNK